MPALDALGWGTYFDSQLSDAERSTLVPGRVVAERGPLFAVAFADGERDASVPGRLRATGDAPTVGDFVLCPPGDAPAIARVLARRSHLSRGAAGRATEEQLLAANVDVVVAVQPLDEGVHPRRLERTVAAILGCGAEPVVVLTKVDLVEDAERLADDARSVCGGVGVMLASGVTGAGVEELHALLLPARTGVFVGPSGAGKSTLVNALVGADVQRTTPVRAHDLRGRHATTARQLFLVPGGGCIIDSPGIRELKLWETGALDAVFDDITALAAGCRFRDCTHGDEPGCAVRAAVEGGALEPGRLESLHKLQREAAALERRRDPVAARAEGRRRNALLRSYQRFQRGRGRGE